MSPGQLASVLIVVGLVFLVIGGTLFLKRDHGHLIAPLTTGLLAGGIDMVFWPAFLWAVGAMFNWALRHYLSAG